MEGIFVIRFFFFNLVLSQVTVPKRKKNRPRSITQRLQLVKQAHKRWNDQSTTLLK